MFYLSILFQQSRKQNGLIFWAIFLRVEVHLYWSMHNSHLIPSFNGKVRGFMVWEHFLSEQRESTSARWNTTMVSSFLYLTPLALAPDSGTFVMLKKLTSVWIFCRFDSCQVLQQSQVISIYQARTRNGFRKNQGDELLSIQFISCHPSWHLHLSSSTAENQRLVVLLLKKFEKEAIPS